MSRERYGASVEYCDTHVVPVVSIRCKAQVGEVTWDMISDGNRTYIVEGPNSLQGIPRTYTPNAALYASFTMHALRIHPDKNRDVIVDLLYRLRHPSYLPSASS